VLGERNVPDPDSPGAFLPHRWDGERLYYGGDRSVRVDGPALIFEREGVEEARGVLELRKANRDPLPVVVHVECDAGDGTEHGAVLRVTCDHEGESCVHEVRTNGCGVLTASVRLTQAGLPQDQKIKWVAIQHKALVDDWAVLWNQDEVTNRSLAPGLRGRGIARTEAVPFAKVPTQIKPKAKSASAEPEKIAKSVRDFVTDDPGGELEIEWTADVAAAGISPDTYGPGSAVLLDTYQCGTGGVETEWSVYGAFLDEPYDTQMQAGLMFRSVSFSGTVTSASLVIPRYDNNNSGSEGDEAGLRCEATNNPVAPLSNNPWGRTYRSTETQVAFPSNGNTVTFNPTTNLNDLIAAGYTFTGLSTQGVHFAFAAGAKGWHNNGEVSWRSVCYARGTLPTLSITYTPSTGSQTITVPLMSSGSSIAAPTVSRGAVAVAPALLAATSSVFEPTVNGAVQISPPLLASTSSVATPAVGRGAVTIAPALIAAASVVLALTIAPGAVAIAPPIVASTASVFEPALASGGATVAPPLLASASTVATPTVSPGAVTISPSFLASASSVFEPTAANGEATLYPPLLASGATVPEPTVTRGAVTVSPALIASASSTYAPAISATIYGVFIVSTASVFAPTVSPGAATIATPFIASASSVFAPVVINGGAVSPVLPSENRFSVPAPDKLLYADWRNRSYWALLQDKKYHVSPRNRKHKVDP